MPYPARVTAALETMQVTGISRSIYAPPLHRVLWHAGLALPPPHLAGFVLNLFISAAWFGIIWGLAMWFALWFRQGMSGSAAVGASFVAGGAFGFFVAIYYSYGARKHKLPSWSEIKARS